MAVGITYAPYSGPGLTLIKPCPSQTQGAVTITGGVAHGIFRYSSRAWHGVQGGWPHPSVMRRAPVLGHEMYDQAVLSEGQNTSRVPSGNVEVPSFAFAWTFRSLFPRLVTALCGLYSSLLSISRCCPSANFCPFRWTYAGQLGSLDMDMDRNRRDSVGFPWNNRYSGDVVAQDGSRPPMGSRLGEVHAVPPQYAGAYVRTTSTPFVEARGPALGAPHIILPTPSDAVCEPSLKELLLEKWPPAPMSELTISETS